MRLQWPLVFTSPLYMQITTYILSVCKRPNAWLFFLYIHQRRFIFRTRSFKFYSTAVRAKLTPNKEASDALCCQLMSLFRKKTKTDQRDAVILYACKRVQTMTCCKLHSDIQGEEKNKTIQTFQFKVFSLANVMQGKFTKTFLQTLNIIPFALSNVQDNNSNMLPSVCKWVQTQTTSVEQVVTFLSTLLK